MESKIESSLFKTAHADFTPASLASKDGDNECTEHDLQIFQSSIESRLLDLHDEY